MHTSPTVPTNKTNPGICGPKESGKVSYWARPIDFNTYSLNFLVQFEERLCQSLMFCLQQSDTKIPFERSLLDGTLIWPISS